MSQSQPASRRLVRRSDDRVIAGVCSGLGTYFGLDPIIFRIGAILLALSGSGLLLYAALWVIVPADTDPPGISNRSRKLIRVAGMIAIAIASLWLVGIAFSVLTGGFIGNFVHLSPFDRFNVSPDIGLGPLEALIPAAIFVGIGFLLLREPPEAAELPPASEVETTELPASGTATTTPIVRARRERSPLTLLTLAAALTAVGVAAVLGNLDIYVLDIGQLAALGFLVLGAGLVVSAWIGRARWLIVIGLMVLPLVLGASLIDFPPTGHIGSRYLFPTSQPLQDVELMAGDIQIDLSEYEFPDGDEDLHVQLGAGSVNVFVPTDVFVDATVNAKLGEASVFRSFQGGFDVGVHGVAGPADAEHRLNLTVDGGIASVYVYRQGRDGPQVILPNSPPEPGAHPKKEGTKKR